MSSKKVSSSSKESQPNMATRKPPRQMAAKACERCRRRKIKCDEFFPCGQCTRMRVACKIEDPAEKRREQQQSAMEDRIKRLEALLIATYTNPNNRIDIPPPGLDQEGLLSNPIIGMDQINVSAQAGSSTQRVKLEPPRLTLQTPASSEFKVQDASDVLSASDYPLDYPYFSPPSSIAHSAPGSASDYYPNGSLPWSVPLASGGSGESTPPASKLRPGERTRASSMSTSEASTQDERLRSPIIHDRNRVSIDTSRASLDIPQIEVTSYDHHQSHSPMGMSPALSPTSVMDMDMPAYYPPELSSGSWSGLSSPSIMAPSPMFEDSLMIVNQSLPSHSRRSSLNSLAPDYEAYNETKRRRAASDVFPIPQQYIYHDGLTAETFLTPSFQHSPVSTMSLQDQNLSCITNQDHIHNRNFLEVVYPLYPILSPQNLPGTQSFNLTTSPTAPLNPHGPLPPGIAQTQAFLTRAISMYIMSRRNSQPIASAQNCFTNGLRSHGAGKWDSLPGIQTAILLAIYMLLSSCKGPNIYMLNANIVAACFDLGLHRSSSTCQPGSLEGNTLLAAYVLDRTIALARGRPSLLKDEDLESQTLNFVKQTLREKVEDGNVRRWPEGGKLWDWWVRFENEVRNDGGQGSLQTDLDLTVDLGMQDQVQGRHPKQQHLQRRSIDRSFKFA